MNVFFQVALDRPARSFRLNCFGRWSDDVRVAFEREIDRQLRGYRADGGPRHSLLTLVDLRESLTQSRDIVIAPRDQTIRYSPASAKIAVLLAPPALRRTQVQHFTPPERHRFFVFEEDALDWLAETDCCAQAMPAPLATTRRSASAPARQRRSTGAS